MIGELLEAKEGESLDQLRTRLGKVLGRSEPVPVAAFLRAVDDPSYATHLITCRNAPGFLEPLLNDPRNAAYAPTSAEDSSAAEVGNAQLLGRAAKALVRWGKAGFSVADEATIQRRESACLSCPRLSEPSKMLQKLLPAKAVSERVGERTGNKTCELCGCQVAKKMRVPTEACPEAHPDEPGMSRWLEPLTEH